MYNVTPNNTGDTLSAMAPNAVREMWQDGCDTFEQTEDILREFEGGSDSVIETKRNFATGAGFTLNFTPRSGFYNKGRSGDQLFTDPSHFAKINIGHDELRVDYLRNAFQYTGRMEEVMGMRGEINSGNNEAMGEWFGREQSFRGTMTMIHKVNSENHVIASARTMDTLRSTDVLTCDEITGMNSILRSMGGKPALMGQDDQGNDIWGNWVIGTTAAVSNGLKLDADYKTLQREAGVRGSGNLLFKGGVAGVDGNHVREWNDVDHDGEGAIGTPLNPKAYLGVPITAGTGTFNITGGGTLNTDGSLTLPEWFRFFPKFAFEFIHNDILSVTASTWELHTVSSNTRFYVLVMNPIKAATDPGKWCIYECNANTGNTLAVTRRLGPSDAGGTQLQTLGGVTWDNAQNSQVHPTGSLIVVCTSRAVAFGYTVMLMKQAMRRGWGAERNHRGQDTEEAGFNTKVYVRSIFGQAPRRRRDGRVPGIMVLKHAINYKGWNMPSVTS